MSRGSKIVSSVIVKGLGTNSRPLVKGFGPSLIRVLIIKVIHAFSKITDVLSLISRRR
jgi:hypothetical protein